MLMLMSPSLPSEGAPEPARGRLGEVEPRAKHAAAAVRRRRRRVPVAGRRGRRVRPLGGRGGRGRGVAAAVAVVPVRLGVVAAVVRRGVVGLVVWLGVVAAAVVRLVLYGRVALAAAAVHGLGVVARAEVLVEDGAVAALERLLPAVRVAEVVDLQSGRRECQKRRGLRFPACPKPCQAKSERDLFPKPSAIN